LADCSHNRMKNVRLIMGVFVLIASLSAGASGQVRVAAQIDTSEDIYVGQSFTYMVIIDGDNKAGQVDLNPLAPYNPQSAGNQDVSQTSMTIINNKVSRNVIKRYVMNYSLTAGRPGQIELPPVTVTLEGENYKTNPVRMNILNPGTTDKLDFDVELSDAKCYVGQPVIMTVKFYVSAEADVGDFQFNIPAFTDDSFYIEDPEISDPQAKMFRLHTGISVAVSQRRVTYKSRNFTLVSFSKVLIPKQAGELDLGTPSVNAALAVERTRSRGPFDEFGFFGSQKQYKRYAVGAKPLKLTVLPLPAEGKPAEFYGLVGRYTIEASATPTKVSVGDPITLTIKIAGSRYLKPVQWPALEQIDELMRNFKLPAQKASPAVEDGVKIFTQTIRANNDTVRSIPPIPLAYFDADKGEYTVAKTSPIALEVAPTKILTNADLQGIDPGRVNRQVEAIKKGLSANYEGPDVLTNQTFSPLAAATSPAYLAIWAVPLAGLIISSLLNFFTRTSPEQLARRRRRQAGSKAVKQLKTISATDTQQRQELLVAAMKQYIGDRFDKVPGSLTPDDCCEIVASATNDAKIATEYKDAISACELSRYASSEADIGAGRIDQIVGIIRSIEKKSKQ
jgi:hypothetical protein